MCVHGWGMHLSGCAPWRTSTVPAGTLARSAKAARRSTVVSSSDENAPQRLYRCTTWRESLCDTQAHRLVGVVDTDVLENLHLLLKIPLENGAKPQLLTRSLTHYEELSGALAHHGHATLQVEDQDAPLQCGQMLDCCCALLPQTGVRCTLTRELNNTDSCPKV